jgi:hypothetical protein
MRDLGPRQAALVALAMFLAGCRGPIESLEPPVVMGQFEPPIVVGACTLRLTSKDETGGLHVLVPPYVAPYSKQKSVLFVMRGQSWAHVHVTQADPVGTVRRDEFVPGNEMATGARGWVLDVEGIWRFRLADDVNGCIQEFSIEARPG